MYMQLQSHCTLHSIVNQLCFSLGSIQITTGGGGQKLVPTVSRRSSDQRDAGPSTSDARYNSTEQVSLPAIACCTSESAAAVPAAVAMVHISAAKWPQDSGGKRQQQQKQRKQQGQTTSAKTVVAGLSHMSAHGMPVGVLLVSLAHTQL